MADESKTKLPSIGSLLRKRFPRGAIKVLFWVRSEKVPASTATAKKARVLTKDTGELISGCTKWRH